MTTLVAFRVANWDTPVWANPNRRESRYARLGATVQYWSLHPLTCWAEYLRYHDIRDPGQAQQHLLRPWVASLDVPDAVLDVSFDNAADHGIEPSALVDEDWSRCQSWAASRSEPALIVPSAALPGTKNMVLFGPRVRSRYGIPPLDPDLDMPCDPIAEAAYVVLDLLRHVRWRGSPHAGYEAWLAGEPEPMPPAVPVLSTI